MKDFILSNLRELSNENQMQLIGGKSPACDADCECNCPCTCNSMNPSASVGNSTSQTGYHSVYGRKQRESMLRM